jgi:glucose 1-dehydrogenase
MKAIVVTPGKPDSVRLADVPEPTLADAPAGRGVLVRVLRVGLDGTDRDINAGEYGAPPPGSDHLILGHESIGVVEQVGGQVTELVPGDLVVPMVRRPGRSLYDSIGKQDFTTDDVYFEHGISLLHGYLTERYVDTPDYLVRIPGGLADVGVLLEPVTVAEKGLGQAYEIQRRLQIWRPGRMFVLGAGPLGIIATLLGRLRGLQVTTFGLAEPPYLNAELVEALGARYVSTRRTSVADAAAGQGPPDLIFEATGFSPLVFEAMDALARNGVLVLASVTGGDRRVEVPADRLNLGFVLGNKVMVGTVNAGRGDFEAGVRDLAMTQAQWPGWLGRLLTHRVDGLAAYREAFRLLDGGEPGVLKAWVDVAGGRR